MIAEMADGTKKDMYDRGFRLGFLGSKDIPGTEPTKPYVNNHLRFIVKYHKDAKFEGARLVGFEVEAFSVHHTYKGVWGKDAQLTSVPLSPDLPPQPVADGPGGDGLGHEAAQVLADAGARVREHGRGPPLRRLGLVGDGRRVLGRDAQRDAARPPYPGG